MNAKQPLPHEIEKRIERVTESGCWIWIGHVTEQGYGAFRTVEKMHRAHRLVYELINGAIPSDAPTLDHLCRVRCCVNPSHLEPVTNKENVLRGIGVSAMNARKDKCWRGHQLSQRPNGNRECNTCKNMSTTKGRARRSIEKDHPSIAIYDHPDEKCRIVYSNGKRMLTATINLCNDPFLFGSMPPKFINIGNFSEGQWVGSATAIDAAIAAEGYEE